MDNNCTMFGKNGLTGFICKDISFFVVKIGKTALAQLTSDGDGDE